MLKANTPPPMSKSKEEILRKQYEEVFRLQKYDESVNRKTNQSYVFPAMEEYSKQQSIAFAEWMEKMDCHKIGVAGRLPVKIYYIGIYYTTPEANKLYAISELYSLFIQSQSLNP